MRFQLTMHGWPIGDRLIPVGTIIDSRDNDDWSVLARGRMPPLNSMALDQEAYEVMSTHYRQHQHHLILTGPNVRR